MGSHVVYFSLALRPLGTWPESPRCYRRLPVVQTTLDHLEKRAPTGVPETQRPGGGFTSEVQHLRPLALFCLVLWSTSPRPGRIISFIRASV